MKRIVFLLLLMCSKNIFAYQVEQTAPNFKGAYLGAGVGNLSASFYNNNVNTQTPAEVPYLVGVQDNSDLNYNNLFGNIFLGYGFVFNRFYIGPEIYISGTSQSGVNKTIQALNSFPTESLTTQTKARLNAWEEGIDGRLGWLATPSTLLFARLGAAFNKINLTSNTTITTAAFVTPTTQQLSYTASKSVVGFRIGAGVEQKLYSRFAMRADYIYTYYGNFSANASNPAPPLGPINNSTQLRLQSQSIIASIIYSF